jgi:hypothetical protein
MSNEILQKIAEATVLSDNRKAGGGSGTDYFIAPRLSIQGGKQISGNEMLSLGDKILLIGPAGSGKTCLLKQLSIQWAQDFLAKRSEYCPLLISCSEINYGSFAAGWELDVGLSDLVKRLTGVKLWRDDMQALFATEKVLPIWDGVDEIPRHELHERFVAGIRYLEKAYPKLRIIVSTRPIAVTSGLIGFVPVQLSVLNAEEVWTHVRNLAGHDSHLANSFTNLIATNRWAAELSTSPLLLRMLWQIFQNQGTIPSSRAQIYNEITDFCLRGWNQQKGISARSEFTLAEIDKALQNLAMTMRIHDTADLHRVHFRAVFEKTYSEKKADKLLDTLCGTGIVVSIGQDIYQFSHHTFLEFYTARAAASSEECFQIILAHPPSKETVLFLAGLLDDATRVIEAVIRQGDLLMAVRCLSESKTHNEALINFTIAEFVRELGLPFAKRLADYVEDRKKEHGNTPHINLLRDYDGVCEKGLASHVKGRRLEKFMADFFGQVFVLVNANLNTENGELDLLFENKRIDPFWIECGGDIFVECKNYLDHVPSKEIGNFADKVSQAHGKLAFFVAVNGFTEDAMRRILNHAAKGTSPLIVPIEGSDLTKMLTAREDFESFLKERIRNVRYVQKY